MTGAPVCIKHGAAKGTPARAKADHLVLSELIGPALARLKGLIESASTPGPTLMAAIREVLERTRYQDPHLMTLEELLPHVRRHRAILDAEKAAEKAAVEGREGPKELPPGTTLRAFYETDGTFVVEPVADTDLEYVAGRGYVRSTRD